MAWVGGLLILTFYLAPLFRDLESWGGTFDWGYFFFLAEVDRISIVRFGQFPLWNPYYCGGSVHLANPQSYTLGPLSPLILVFGTPLGIRLMLAATALLAADGVRRWTVGLGADPAAGWLAGVVFATSGAMAQHLGGGHIGWMAFAFLPYVFWSFDRALDGARWGIAAGGIGLAFILFHFGVYPYPYSCLALAVYGLARGVAVRAPARAVGVGLAMAVLSLGVAGIRLVPLAEFISRFPRKVVDFDYLLIPELWTIYAERHTERLFGTHGWVWPEYGNYVGPLGVLLFFAGLVFVGVDLGRRRGASFVPPAVGALVFLLFQMGNRPYLPWTYVRKLPVYENLRVPSRFTTLVGLFGAALIALALTRAFRFAQSRRGRAGAALWGLCAVLGLAVLFDAASFNRQQWFQTFGTPPPADRPSPGFHQVSGSRFRMYAYPRVNRGSIDCFEESPLPISRRLGSSLAAEEYPEHAATGTVSRVKWSPNRIELEVDFAEPGRVLVNQNHNPGWKASAGEVVSVDGLLGVEMPAGSHRLVLRYLPGSFLVGVAVTMLALLAAGVLMTSGRRPAR